MLKVFGNIVRSKRKISGANGLNPRRTSLVCIATLFTQIVICQSAIATDQGVATQSLPPSEIEGGIGQFGGIPTYDPDIAIPGIGSGWDAADVHEGGITTGPIGGSVGINEAQSESEVKDENSAKSGGGDAGEQGAAAKGNFGGGDEKSMGQLLYELGETSPNVVKIHKNHKANFIGIDESGIIIIGQAENSLKKSDGRAAEGKKDNERIEVPDSVVNASPSADKPEPVEFYDMPLNKLINISLAE